MSALSGSGTDSAITEQPVTLAELDASVGGGPEVPEDEIAVRYYSDEALLSAIRSRRNGPAADRLSP